VPLYIKDDETAALVARLAQLHGLSKQGAVWMAVEAALDKAADESPSKPDSGNYGLRTRCLPLRENARTRRSSTICQVGFDAFRGCIGANIDPDPGERRARSRCQLRTRPGPPLLRDFSLGDCGRPLPRVAIFGRTCAGSPAAVCERTRFSPRFYRRNRIRHRVRCLRALRQRSTPRETEHGRLLRIRLRESQPRKSAFQRRRLHENRHRGGPSVVTTARSPAILVGERKGRPCPAITTC
jgi:hypothetical protein